MYHGKKRTIEEVKRTPEEIKKQEELAEKISAMLSEFLEIRKGEKKVDDPLEFCNIMVQLCPEIPHVYNFRREIFLKRCEELGLEQQYKMIGQEIMMTLALLKKRPKCYSIWNHRQWLILKAFDIEKQIVKATGKEMSPGVVEQDLQICSKMLNLDERNFHAWNYRIWLVRDVLKYDRKLVQSELEYLKKKIEDNFSNFSAFHFKSKLFAVQHEQKLVEKLDSQIINYYLDEEQLKEELEMVKNAIFIQPNEQGVWQYYRWLISLQIPFQIIHGQCLSESTSQEYRIRLTSSQKITSYLQNIKVKEEGVKITSLKADNSICDGEFSYVYILELNCSEAMPKELTIQILSNEDVLNSEDLQTLCQEHELKKKNLIKSQFTVNTEQRTITLTESENSSPQLSKALKLLEEEEQFLSEVMESEPENNFSLHHKIFLAKTLIYLQFLQMGTAISEKQVDLAQQIVDTLQVLKKVSPRQIQFLQIQEQKMSIFKLMLQKKQTFEFEQLQNARFETNDLLPFMTCFKSKQN